MSMLSAQVDKLRERAKELRQGRWSDGADDARLMEDAADTIWELRGMVHKERAENAELRELVGELWDGYMDPPCEDCPLKGKPTCTDCPICAREAAVIDCMHELGVGGLMDERRRS